MLKSQLEIFEKIKEYKKIHFPEQRMVFEPSYDYYDEVNIGFPDKKAIITIFTDSVWDDIKRIIDCRVINNNDKICYICDREFTNILFTGCEKCGTPTCFNCNIKNYRANKEINKCAFCRHQIGYEMNEKDVEWCINEMLSRLLRK